MRYDSLEGENYSDSEYENYSSITGFVYGKGLTKMRAYERL